MKNETVIQNLSGECKTNLNVILFYSKRNENIVVIMTNEI